MTWINKQWDREYITLAETKIKQMVSLFIMIYGRKILNYFQDAKVS